MTSKYKLNITQELSIYCFEQRTLAIEDMEWKIYQKHSTHHNRMCKPWTKDFVAQYLFMLTASQKT